MSLTFVSAFLDLREDRSKDKSVETCFNHFQRLASSGIKLHVFISPQYYHYHKDSIPQTDNIYVELIELQNLTTYKELADIQYNLPSVRTGHHDTANFMILMNAKIEIVKRAIDANVFGTSHFAWIDFSICHVLKHWNSSCKFLQLMSATALQDTCLIFPGCWNKGAEIQTVFTNIHWRFCGGFFVGDRTSLVNFYNLYRTHFAETVRASGILVWETNMWHLLEVYHNLNPQWFSANHDDSILRIPFRTFKTAASLTTIPSRIEHECRATLDSLLGQVDQIYLSIANTYKRFGDVPTIPDFLQQEPYKSAVTVIRGEDYGPATKYLGALTVIPANSWIFVCDDDQEYSANLLERMSRVVDSVAVYQNHYRSILTKTSGGIIHGYVGNLIHESLLRDLPSFPLPPCAYFVDDQWMSIYLYKKAIQIHATNIEPYYEIFKVLDNHHEKWGSNSLSGLHNRDEKVKELCEFFKVRFCHDEGLPDLLTNVS